MGNKSQNIKNYIKDIGVRNQLFAFAGTDDSSTSSESAQTTIDIWKNSNVGVKVGQNSVIPVVSNIKWIEKKPYIPWSSININYGNYYVYNEENGYVYLCISDNEKFRKDYRGNNVSNIRPSHTTGTQTYSDGYVWKVLYKITPSLERFVTSSWIPVVSFETFDSSTQSTLSQQIITYCNPDTPTSKGICAVFLKQPLIQADTLTEYSVGDLYATLEETKCNECFNLFLDNDKFTSIYYGSKGSVPTSITINDKFTEVGNSIQSNDISMSSPYYYLYDINNSDDILEGSIISCFVNLSEFTGTQLQVTSENPEFIVSSNTGSGARIQLLTYITNNGAIVVNGINVINPGIGYTDVTLEMDQNIFVDTSIKDLILAVIEVNLDKIDGFGFDPVDVLDAQHMMIDVKIDKTQLNNAKIELPNSLNFFGLLVNPIETTNNGNEIISGSIDNKKLDTIYRTSSKIEVTKVSTNRLPVVGDKVDLTYTTNGQTSTVFGAKITGTEEISSTVRRVELSNIQYNIVDKLVGANVYTSGSEYSTITSIIEKPNFVQYSGKILSTTKTNDLSIEDPETVIIRINMVKGM